MGLIINKHIKKMFKGYPVISDKYNIAGGTLAGSNPVEFGDLVAYTATAGYYEKAIGTALPAAGLAGLVMSTNVKLTDTWAGESEPKTKVGEQFNLMLDGYIAAKVVITTDTLTNLAAGKQVYYKLGASASDAIELASSDAGDAALAGYSFTGIYEQIDSTHALAAIRVK